MYVIIVHFEIEAQHVDSFRPVMQQQARNSLQHELGCRQFDVCYDHDNRCRCLLYEKYDNRAAFDAHLATDHFKEFNTTVTPWITSKVVEAWFDESSD